MSLTEDYTEAVEEIFEEEWTTREGKKVPESKDLGLGNDAVELDGTVLYADLDDSTNLVDNFEPEFAAEIYKAYLNCAAKVIRSEGGEITSYDGDRIMAVYIGDSPNSSAAKSALKNKLHSHQNYQSSHKKALSYNALSRQTGSRY